MHIVSFKHLELQISQLSTIVNPRQPGIIRSNTIQNSNNNGHCIKFATLAGYQTIDPLMSSMVEDGIIKDDEVEEDSREQVDKMIKEAEVSLKVVPIHRPP